MSDLAAVLNALPGRELETALVRCCASMRWVAGMRAHAPFQSEPGTLELAEEIWWALDPEDWLEAFAAHPRIGDREVTERWARVEQAGVEAAGEAVLETLAERNTEYEARFGFVFLICASGLSASEMLAALDGRMANTADIELKIAAREHGKITRLRLERLAEEA